MTERLSVPAFGVFDTEKDDFVVVEGRYRFYWLREAAERMIVALGDPRYVVGETTISNQSDDEDDFS